jgi:glycosyltransferase involved in cell wall biosynthesis
VASALDQGSGVERVIIVDDASVDGTLSVAHELSRDERVRVVARTLNGGPSRARNDGLAGVRSDFVVFLDADDRLVPGAIDALVGGWRDDAVCVFGRFRAVDEGGQDLDIGTWAREQLRPVVRRRGRFIASPDGFSAEAILTRLVTPPPGAALVRTSAAQRVGGFNASVARSEDVDFWVRLSDWGPLIMVDVIVLAYLRRRTQRSANTRHRQLGRLRTMSHIVWTSPSSSAARQRARGLAAHHLDRGDTRWRYGARSTRDAAFALRSAGLAALFRLVGLAASVRLATRAGSRRV